MSRAIDTTAPAVARRRGLPADVDELRSHFPILDHKTYLINNSLGAMPQAVEDSLSRYVESWRTRGVRAWDEAGWWELPIDVGDAVAPFLGVGRGQVSMHQNVTIATAIFLSCLDYPAERNRIVYTDQNFPSLRYLIEGEQRKGAEIVVIPSDGVRVELAKLLEAIDERTRLVPISHVLFRSAFIQDAAAIASRCRAVGALLVLDVYQSVGILPLALSEWKVDAAVGGCLKWLCGGPGNAFLWVRPDLSKRLEPALTGWQADQSPFDFHPHLDRAPSGARRFLTGTPNVPALFACLPGLEILSSLDPEEVRARSLELTGRILQLADEHGLEVSSSRLPEERGGTVTVAPPDAEQLSRRLIEAGILCDYRPEAGIRLSPHVYNTLEECELAIDHLRRTF